MPDFTVHQYGIDTSGRAILMTAYAHDIRGRVLADPRVRPFADRVVLIQGCFMYRIPGGGAGQSAGFHDLAGCWDDRSRDLTARERKTLVKVYRENGVASWLRDQTHGGFDPHFHNLLGTDRPLASGAQWQWSEYIAGRDGLASHGPDYHPRPNPLVLIPPEVEDVTPQDKQDIADMVAAKLAANNDTLVKALLAGAVNKAGDSVKKALRVAAGLGD